MWNAPVAYERRVEARAEFKESVVRGPLMGSSRHLWLYAFMESGSLGEQKPSRIEICRSEKFLFKWSSLKSRQRRLDVRIPHGELHALGELCRR